MASGKQSLWSRLDRKSHEEFPVYLDDSDDCYFAREYIAGGGFQASEANQLISNFKKGVDRKDNIYEWRHRIHAVNKFALELSNALAKNIILANIPSSKCLSDPEYDNRFEDMFLVLKKLRPDLKIENPISSIVSVVASHHGGTRNPEEISENLVWKGFEDKIPRHIVLVDDVLTSGAHFKACKELIQYHCPQTIVSGVFWARRVGSENEWF